MGRNLLSRFIRQLDALVRARVKVMPRGVKFRFGNNQTRVSQTRILLPLQAEYNELWLSIEGVPGSTPFLLSKKALQQLGGVIDTNTCHLERLHCILYFQTGAIVLFLVDLASLCQEQARACRGRGGGGWLSSSL